MNDETTMKSMETDTKSKKKKPVVANLVRVSVCYVGPTIPHVMQKNAVICGYEDKVKVQLDSIAEKYPQFNKLVCPVSELATTKARLNAGHNAISNAYSEMLKTISKEGK